VTPLIEQGKVQLLRGNWNALLVNQLSLFPAGEYDDLVDSFCQGLLYLSAGLGSFANEIRPVIAKSLVQDNIQEESTAFDNSRFITRRRKKENVLTGYWN
jgi:hypothetical protein